MSLKLIFITGATGFIGAATAEAALKAGYRLRISVRKDAQIEKLKGLFSQYADKTEFVIVPDITAPGAFSKVLDGVDYVLHLASPLAKSTRKEELFTPAVEGTLSILRDAAKVGSIKKVVVTSSIAALQPTKGVPEGGVIKEEPGWDLSVDAEANFDAGDDTATAFAIYSASKRLANNASWEFVQKEKPGFELFTIHPAFVYGHNLLQGSARELEGSTNGLLFSSIMNGVFSDAVLTSVYIGDVADVHIKVLDESVQKGTKYLVHGKRYVWTDVAEILERDYPGIPHKLARDRNPDLKRTDTSRVEKELGVTWTKPEIMIREVLDQQLAFLK